MSDRVDGLPTLEPFSVGYLLEPDLPAEEELERQHAFLLAITQWVQQVGVSRTMAAVRETGHVLRPEPNAASGWLIFRETHPDGRRELQISCTEDGTEVMITTPDTDAEWERILAARKQGLTAGQQAQEALREQFYQRGGDLYVLSAEEATLRAEADQLLLALYTFDMELNNGGFVQYLDNTEGRFAGETLRYLELIGATRARELLQNAVALVGGTFDGELDRRQLDALDAYEEELTALDFLYYDLDEDIALLAMQWVGADSGAGDRV